jgi:superoxide reductase
MMNYVYILECEDGSYYTGWTTDPGKRLAAHQSGKGARYTRSHHPLRIVYCASFETKNKALKEEWRIKHLSRKEKTELIENYRKINHTEAKRRSLNMKDLRFFRCDKCKKMFVMIHEHGCPTMCCGQEMKELTANTTDGAAEKHVPVVTREGNKLSVNVGSVDHPMLEAHYIEFIALQTEKGFRIEYLQPGDKPCADFYSEEPVKAVYEFCNLHGLWKTES